MSYTQQLAIFEAAQRCPFCGRILVRKSEDVMNTKTGMRERRTDATVKLCPNGHGSLTSRPGVRGVDLVFTVNEEYGFEVEALTVKASSNTKAKKK